MKKEQVEQLLNGAIAAYHAHEEAKKTFRKWNDRYRELEPKDAYELIDEFLQFAHEEQSYKVEYDKEVEKVDQARTALWKARDRFNGRLPALVWFKVGDCGVGIGFEASWEAYISVEPWSDEMPKLDHT